MIDTHCHIQRGDAAAAASSNAPPTATPAQAHAQADGESDDVRYCVMAVEEEEDWAVLPSLDHSEVAAFGLGIHPWRAHRAANGWEKRLEEALLAHPEALVGEIGLDKAARTPETGQTEWAAQLSCFCTQMRLAGRLDRPASVHCVQAHGTLYDYLKEAQAKGEPTPPTVALHSYTGSPDLAVSLLKLPRVGQGVFFGFSAAVNLKTPAMAAKFKDVVARIPHDRILLESDLDQRRDIPQALGKVCEALAAAMGLEQSVVVQQCQRNAARFLRRAAVP